jgi:NADPH2:quinone reductase
VFAETIRSLAVQGRHATVGYVDHVLKAEIDLDALHTKRLTLFGVSNRLRTPEQRAVTARRPIRPIAPSGSLLP